MLILVADDERINRLYMDHLFRGTGHSLVHASNGAEAIRIVGEQEVDLVFMDVRMPVLDGLEATRRIRAGEAGAERAEVPIVIMTAYVDDEEHERYRQAGAGAIVTKPIHGRALVNVVDEYAGRTQRSDQ